MSSQVVFNVSNLKTFFDTSVNSSEQFLIIQSSFNLISTGFKADIHLKLHPKIALKFNFVVTNSYYLHRNVEICGNALKLPFEITLYYMDSRKTFEFLDKFNVPDSTTNPGCCSNERYKFFSYNGMESDKFFNQNLYLLVNVKPKSTPLLKMDVKVPENEMPAQFASLYDDQLFTDFKIICGDQEFLVHKLVLAARCTVFRAMLQLEIKETQENQIEITDFEPKIVKEMITFMYKDNISSGLEKEELEEILVLADKYNLNKLKAICIKGLTTSIESLNDALEVYAIATSHHVTEVKDAVLEFIKGNPHILSK